jgi:hypothetical protein
MVHKITTLLSGEVGKQKRPSVESCLGKLRLLEDLQGDGAAVRHTEKEAAEK